MTRMTRKTICAIVLGIFIVLTFCTLAWATDGFTNWKASSWFNYWGKGAPVTVEQAPEQFPETSAYIGTKNAGVVHDSETTATVEVQRYDNPTLSYSTQGVRVNGGSSHGDILKIYVYDDVDYALELSYADSEYLNPNDPFGTSFIVPYNIFYSIFGDRNGGALTVKNCGRGEYSDSLGFLAPTPSYSTAGPTFISNNSTFFYRGSGVNPYWDGCIYILPIPIRASDNFEYVIKILDRSFSYANSDNAEWFNNSSYENSEAVTVYDDRYEIDLSKVGFAENIKALNCIYFRPHVKDVMNFDCNVIQPDVETQFAISQLDNPENIHMDGNYLVWDEVPGAQGYTVYCADSMSLTGNKILSEPRVEIGRLAEGEHTFRVRALGNIGKQLAMSQSAKFSAFNASYTVQPLVVLTFDLDGDTISKFVPKDSTLFDYLYEVNIPDRTFGGWYYDSGFSSPIGSEDKIDKDTTIYARLSDKPVTDRPLTWWEIHKWQVLIPCFVALGLALIGGIAVAVTKKKKH